MILKYIWPIMFISSSLSVKTPPEANYYLAAVVEYCPIRVNDGYESLMKNVEQYTIIISEASRKADIVVFPEDGLIRDYSTFVEVPLGNNVKFPDNENLHPALLKLSQAARSNGIYVVVNLHEEDKSGSHTYHYNTNVVFDRNGNIIVRYRKSHLFGEKLDIPSKPEHAYFDTDFGVRFGTFTCFELLFKDPAVEIVKQHNITDIVYPTWWYSSLPFFTAIQAQAGWAYAADVNFLASGGNSVLSGQTGSGIYAGKKGPVVYVQSQRNKSVILHAKLIKKGKEGMSTGEMSEPVYQGKLYTLKSLEDPSLRSMESFLLTPTSENNTVYTDGRTKVDEFFSKKLCQNEFCCFFNISASFNYKKTLDSSSPNVLNPLHYRLGVFNGKQSYMFTNVGVQYCAIISCLDEDVSSCGKPGDISRRPILTKFGYLDSITFNSVKITTSSLENDRITLPNILEISGNSENFGSLMDTNKFFFSVTNNVGELSLTSDKLATAAIYARVFSRDDPLPVPSSSDGSKFSIFLIFAALSCAFSFIQ